MKFYEFHDTELSGIVENAYHAAAVDEHRQDYDVCLWNPQSKPDKRLSNGGSSAPTAMSAGAIRIGGFPISRSAGCKTRQAPLDWD